MRPNKRTLDQAIMTAARRRIQVISKLKDPRYEFMQNLLKEKTNGPKTNDIRTNADEKT